MIDKKITVELTPEDIHFIITEWRRLHNSGTEFQEERWDNIALKLTEALFKEDNHD